MMFSSSFSQIDRHVVWGARPGSLLILAGFGLVIGMEALFAPNQIETAAGIKPAAIDATIASSPCLPHDEALGNTGGDPYAFYVFNREEELASRRSAPSCASTVANAVDDIRQDLLVARHGSLINQASAAPTAP